jgi:hypothetical protein
LINLVLGDAYLEAALGLDDSDRTTRFEKQFASATGFTPSPRQASPYHEECNPV